MIDTRTDYCLNCCQRRSGPVCARCGTVTPAQLAGSCTSHLPFGIVLDDKYIVGRVLGQGGFSITYLGVDRTIGLRVALKELFPSDLVFRSVDGVLVEARSAEDADRFQHALEDFTREGGILAELGSNKHVVDVKGYFQENSTAYLVTELIDGQTVAALREGGSTRLSEDRVVEIALAVIDGLRIVHQKGLVHRDLKPENIGMTAAGEYKLLDFGAARKFTNKRLTGIATMGFAPPEQYDEKGDQGPWTDVYGLGATMFCLLTGKEPPAANYRPDDDLPLLRKQLAPYARGPVSDVVVKALELLPERRYQDAGELEHALRRAVGAREPARPEPLLSSQPRVPQGPAGAATVDERDEAPRIISGNPRKTGMGTNRGAQASSPRNFPPEPPHRTAPVSQPLPPPPNTRPDRRKVLFALAGVAAAIIVVALATKVPDPLAASTWVSDYQAVENMAVVRALPEEQRSFMRNAPSVTVTFHRGWISFEGPAQKKIEGKYFARRETPDGVVPVSVTKDNKGYVLRARIERDALLLEQNGVFLGFHRSSPGAK